MNTIQMCNIVLTNAGRAVVRDSVHFVSMFTHGVKADSAVISDNGDLHVQIQCGVDDIIVAPVSIGEWHFKSAVLH